MPKRFDISMIGDKALIKKFNSLEPKLAKKILNKSLRKAAKIVLVQAKANVRVVSGNTSKALRKGLTLKKLKGKKRRRNQVSVDVRTPTRSEMGIGNNEKWYSPAHIELGTRFTRPLSYLRSATKQKASTVMALLRREIGAGITKLARK